MHLIWTFAWTLLILAVLTSVGVSSPFGREEIKNQTAVAGKDLTLPAGSTKLHGEFSVVWSFSNSSEEVKLVTYDSGETPKYSHKNLHLNATTGALTIKSVGIEDQGVYNAEITNGDNKVRRYTYEVTVTEPSPDPPQMQRSHLEVIIPCIVIGFIVFLLLLFLACRHQKSQKEKRSRPEHQLEAENLHDSEEGGGHAGSRGSISTGVTIPSTAG